MTAKLCEEWLKKAEEDYQTALVLAQKKKSFFFNTICFHCQQSAEKYLKAYLALLQIPFPKTHDLILLRQICVNQGADFEVIAELILSLNPYSVEYRYPGEQANRKDAERALAASEKVRHFLKEKIAVEKKGKKK